MDPGEGSGACAAAAPRTLPSRGNGAVDTPAPPRPSPPPTWELAALVQVPRLDRVRPGGVVALRLLVPARREGEPRGQDSIASRWLTQWGPSLPPQGPQGPLAPGRGASATPRPRPRGLLGPVSLFQAEACACLPRAGRFAFPVLISAFPPERTEEHGVSVQGSLFVPVRGRQRAAGAVGASGHLALTSLTVPGPRRTPGTAK